MAEIRRCGYSSAETDGSYGEKEKEKGEWRTERARFYTERAGMLARDSLCTD